MYIELSSALIEQFASIANDDVIECLINARTAFRGKYHLICTETRSDALSAIRALPSECSCLCQPMFVDIHSKFTQYAGVKDRTGLYVRIIPDFKGADIIIDGASSVIRVGLDVASNQEFWKPTSLLLESASDHPYFNFIFSNKLKGLPYAFEVKQGGGGAINKEITRLVKNESFLLCIVDSDRISPSCSIGPTASKVKTAFDELQRQSLTNLASYYVFDCHELENLFSFDVFLESLANINAQYKKCLMRIKGVETDPTYHEMRKYFDFKKGFLYKKTKDNAYIQSAFAPSPFFCNQYNVNICRECENCNHQIVEGCGSNMLNLLFGNTGIGNQNFLLPDEVFLTDPSGVSEEWARISDLVFKWCCSIPSCSAAV